MYDDISTSYCTPNKMYTFKAYSYKKDDHTSLKLELYNNLEVLLFSIRLQKETVRRIFDSMFEYIEDFFGVTDSYGIELGFCPPLMDNYVFYFTRNVIPGTGGKSLIYNEDEFEDFTWFEILKSPLRPNIQPQTVMAIPITDAELYVFIYEILFKHLSPSGDPIDLYKEMI